MVIGKSRGKVSALWKTYSLLALILLLLAVGCDTSKKDWNTAQQENTVRAYEMFLEKHPDSKFSRQAKQKIELLDWRKARKERSTEAFRKFLEKHPESGFALQARKEIELLEYRAWQRAQEINTPQAYEQFLEEHPESEFTQEAIDQIEYLIWFGAQQRNTPQAYKAYLEKYPEGRYARKALQSIELIAWRKAQYQNTIKAYEQFLEEYPEGELAQEAKENIETLKWLSDKRVSVFIAKDFGEAREFKGADINSLVGSIMRTFLLSSSSDDKCETSLKIRINGTPLGSYYKESDQNLPAKYRYTGARVVIDLTFNSKASGKIQKKLEGLVEVPPSTLTTGGERPSDAPFDSAIAKAKLDEALIRIFYTFLSSQGDTGKAHAVDSVSKFLKSTNPDRVEAAEAMLREIGEPAVEPLTRRLKSEDEQVRKRAAKLLGEIGNRKAIEPLVVRLADEQEGVREKALEALDKIDKKWRESEEAKTAIERLIDMLSDEEKYVRKDAAEALVEITGKDFGENATEWEEWWKGNKGNPENPRSSDQRVKKPPDADPQSRARLDGLLTLAQPLHYIV